MQLDPLERQACSHLLIEVLQGEHLRRTGIRCEFSTRHLILYFNPLCLPPLPSFFMHHYFTFFYHWFYIKFPYICDFGIESGIEFIQ